MKYTLLGILFLLSACTYAGPYVTDISKNADGSLNVKKCMVEHNFWGYISTQECTTEVIK